MEKLRKFKPVLASCSQGQKRSGVEDGCSYVYNSFVRDMCDAQPFKLVHSQFETQQGY
jgi:arginase